MTVSTEVNQAAYTGNGVTTVFPYTFRILNSNNLTVTQINLQETETVLTLGTDYAVSGAGSYNGGAVTLPQPLPNGYSLVIVRDLDIVQETDLRNQGTFFAEVHENAFDYLTMLIQQVTSWLGLALRRPTIKSKFYDAKQYRIANLADPVNAQDAVNNRTMKSYVEKMIAGVVGGFGWFIQAGSGAVYRTFQDKMRDEVSVKDYGAIGDGITDATSSFVQAVEAVGRGYVPAGTFLVDISKIDISLYDGVGDILTTSGVRIAVQKFHEQTNIIQAKLMTPNFGFDNGTIDTSIYPGARNALQGISTLEIDGVTKLFMIQRVAGGSWSSTTRCRIIETDLLLDGSISEINIYSQEINVGHGIDLSARIEGGEIYLYSSQSVDSLYPDEKAGKGYSRIHWRGSATSQSDVESFVLWGQLGSGHKFEKLNRATVKISDDGKWLIMASAPVDSGAGRMILLYDFEEIISSSDKINLSPSYIVKYSIPTTQNSNVIQGIMSDGRSITISLGATTIFSPNYIADIGFDGTQNVLQQHEAGLEQYGVSGLLNNSSYGFPWRFEPEGCCSYKGGRIISIAEGWVSNAKVVSWRGYNWACIATDDSTGVPPSNGSYWVRTTKAITDGAWNSTTNYYSSSNFSHEMKSIYYIGPSLDLPQESPPVTGIQDKEDPSQVPTGQGAGATSAGFQWRSSFTIRAWAAAIGKYFDALWYDLDSKLRVYDQREGSDNSQYVSVQSSFTNVLKAMILRGGGASAAESALLRLHHRNDPTYPAHIIESTKTNGEFSRVTNDQGNTRLVSLSGSVPLSLYRGDDGAMFEFGKIVGTPLFAFYRGSGSPEGIITAPRGSLYVAATNATSATFYVKESGTGNTGWVAK